STSVSISNNGNAVYTANVTLGGVSVRLLLDTGSSDLWVSFPDETPNTNSTGKSLTLAYAVGSASAGTIRTADLEFGGYTVSDQAFLLVTDANTFSTNIHTQGYDGVLGLGPNKGSAILDELDDNSGDTMLSRIFRNNPTDSDYISFLLPRKNDPSQNFTGQFTISEVVSEFSNITSQNEIDVETVLELLEAEQHWQALTDANRGIIGPDGEVIQYSSLVPKAPDGQLVAVFDSGFTFSQVPRAISDAIYGRVQNAVYDTDNEYWTIPCGQLLNITFNFGNTSFPISPLDTVDNNFGITNAAGKPVCIGAFQPITTAFSVLGNYDMIMGMNFLRNAYTLMDFGDWADDTDNSGHPYLQMLPITNVEAAHNAFVKERLGGNDTTGDSRWWLVPEADAKSSPVSAEEKKKLYEEMILSRWPYIFAGCFVALLLIIGLIVWRCCCRRR
ncbi:acid protease, partial [Fistulina hepatica ATCC 64428]